MVTERGLAVLRAIVQDFVDSREPVGSKAIVERHSFGVSAATIRNDMAQLEEEELIVAPHTSSGRIPTDKGYRLFVDQLADRRVLSAAAKRAIGDFLDESLGLDEVLGRTVRLLAQLTNQVAIVQYPTFGTARVRRIEIVALGAGRLLAVLITDGGQVQQRIFDVGGDPGEETIGRVTAAINRTLGGLGVAEVLPAVDDVASAVEPVDRPVAEAASAAVSAMLGAFRRDRLVLAGAANLARTEEDFRGSIYPVLEALEEQVVLLRLFGEMQADPTGMSVSIGRENASFGLAETSVLLSDYRSSGGELARVGVLGPTRMDYQGNMATVRAVARYLSRQLADD